MEEKFKLLKQQLSNPETKVKLIAAAEQHKHYIGKKILGRDFIVTQGGLVGAASESETDLHLFFDGEDRVVSGKKVSEWLKLYGPFEIDAKPAAGAEPKK